MNYSNKAGMATICMGAVLLSPVSFAKQEADKPGFYASVTAKYLTDDNIYRAATTEQSDDVASVSANLLLIKAFGKHQFTAEYTGDYASYDKNSTEDYTDHFVNLDLLLDLSKKFNIDLQANYNKGHEARGSAGIATTTTGDINEWDEKRLFAGFTYGRQTAKAQLELDLATSEIEYTNNNQSARDRGNQIVSVRGFYNVGNKTALFVEAKQNVVDYDLAVSSGLDSTETFYHLGLRWDATNKTTGEIKVGSFDKDFDLASQKDGDGTSYEASISWAPKTYSQFTLGLSRAPQESALASDNFYTSRLISLGWDHEFGSKLALNVNVSDGLDEYATTTREDKLTNAALGVNYEFRRWMDVGLNYSYSKRDSTDNTADYTDNLVSLSVTFSK